MKQQIADAFAEACSQVDRALVEGEAPLEIVAHHTEAADRILIDVFANALQVCGGDGDGLALVALGGYGRRELTPASDLDLLLLHRGRPMSDVEEVNRSFVYPLWDAGRDLGDRVREPREVLQALTEIEEAAAFLDARLIAGDGRLFEDLHTSVMQRLERGRASFLADLAEASVDRHSRFGHAGHLLEPNIRDSAGGLRDIHTLHWASKLVPGADGLDGLMTSGHLSELDHRLLTRARDFLLELRLHLHRLTGRHQDQLYLAEQDAIAERLSYPDDPVRSAADALMQAFYRHARDVDAVAQSFWERTLRPKRRFFRRSTPSSRPVGDGCVVRDGRLEVVAVTHPADDPAGWLRAFLHAVRSGVRMGRASLGRLYDDVAEAGELRWSPEARTVFVEILQSGDVGALEAMDASGLLPALIPEWEPIRCLPQRDLYHRFTVDRHLFEVVAELARSRSSDEADVHDAWSRVGDTDGLFVGALLHDVGKGRGGDHSGLGEELALAASERMGLGAARIDDVRFCVREHLTLASLATHRDLSDPHTIDDAVRAIGDARRLAMLYLLTRADSLATGPEAWSSFRAALVRELYARTREVLEGSARTRTAGVSERLSELGVEADAVETLLAPMPDQWIVDTDVTAARRQLDLLREPLGANELRTSVHDLTDAIEFVVIADDRPGLFATVTGVLNLRGIDIHDAEIYTRTDGIAIEVFRVRGSHGVVPEDRWARVRADISAVLAGTLDLDDALARKAQQSRSRRHARVRTGRLHVVVDATASATSTIVEVHASDRPGLLREITQVLKAQGCNLTFAKVATYGTEVVDVFYVCDLQGTKITDAEQLEEIERALRSRLASDEAGAAG